MTRAFTLLEVLIAVGLLLVGLLAIVSVFIHGLKMSAQAREIGTATQVAREQMEHIGYNQRIFGFDNLPTGSYRYNGLTMDAVTGSGPAAFPPAPYPKTNLNQTDFLVVVYGDQPSTFLKSVRVEVYWHPRHFVTLETHFHP
jgi:type II secretory pathway pseudopilin PulG